MQTKYKNISKSSIENLPELSWGQKVGGPFLDITNAHIESGADYTALKRSEMRHQETESLIGEGGAAATLF